MNQTHQKPKTAPRLRETLSSDLRQADFLRNVGREFDDVQGFYLDPAERRRLESMGWLKRVFVIGWLLVKNMLLRLTPVRRMLLVTGILFMLLDSLKLGVNETSAGANLGFFGMLLLLFVLMLELKDRTIARDELEAGRKVQQALMPDPHPSFPGWSLSLFTRPANEVGGDLVDFIRMDDSRAALVLADVSGKGLQAALLMAKLQATLRVLAQECSSLGVCLGRANRVFHRDGIPGSFASLLSVEIRSDSGEIRFANAGHLPPLLVTANDVRTMSKGQPALGLRSESLYEEQRLTLEPGEIFFVYSDGLTEAVDEAGNFYGEERAVALAGSFRGLLADEIAARVTAAVDGFRRNARANDDLSFLVLRKL
jgi:hypothetical protein